MNTLFSIDGAKEMLTTIQPYISASRLAAIQKRIIVWQTATQVQTNPTVSTSLPPLVMRTKGLPRSLDPLYFTLKHHDSK